MVVNPTNKGAVRFTNSAFWGPSSLIAQLDSAGTVVGRECHGFRGVDHYWSASSSGPWLERIEVPTLVLNARNDPFLPEEALLAASRKAAPSVLLEFPRNGGHFGLPYR